MDQEPGSGWHSYGRGRAGEVAQHIERSDEVHPRDQSLESPVPAAPSGQLARKNVPLQTTLACNGEHTLQAWFNFVGVISLGRRDGCVGEPHRQRNYTAFAGLEFENHVGITPDSPITDHYGRCPET